VVVRAAGNPVLPPQAIPARETRGTAQLTEPEAGDWSAVREAMRTRLRELKMSAGELARQTCLSRRAAKATLRVASL
jgi:hypothetical protein